MFGKLPDLFDRNFAVGFFIPASVLLGGVYLILYAFDLLPDWLSATDFETFLNAAIVVGAAWLVSLALLAINRPWVRMIEGYGDFNPLRVFQDHATVRFLQDALPLFRLQKQIDEARQMGTEEPDRDPDFANKLYRAAVRFPDKESLVLPTRFGNRYRAVEVYSRVIYGLDAIAAWGRLEAVLPEEFRARLAEEKAQLDFSINLLLAGVLSLVLYFGLVIQTGGLVATWLPFLFVAIAIFGYVAALASLSTYGHYVNSAFDLYRSELAGQFGLELPRSTIAERDMWRQVSRMIIYRSAEACDQLVKYRRKE